MRYRCAILPALALWGCGASAGNFNDGHQFLQRIPSMLGPVRLAFRSIGYGRREGQEVRYLKSTSGASAPLFIMIDAHAWDCRAPFFTPAWLPDYLSNHGYAVAIIGEAPSFTADALPADMAAGLAKLLADRSHEIDRTRIILFGDGSDGQLALRLATEPRWLESAGVPFASIRAAVVLNGDGIAPDMPAPPPEQAGGTIRSYRPHRPPELSLRFALEPPNAPNFLLMTSGMPAAYAQQTIRMGDALRAAGATVTMRDLPPMRENMPRTQIGAPGNVDAAALLRFLNGLR